MNNECLIGISDAFSAFVYGYPSSCPRARCTPNKSAPTLRYTRRPGPIYTSHACRHLPSAVPWISEDRLLLKAVHVNFIRTKKLQLALLKAVHIYKNQYSQNIEKWQFKLVKAVYVYKNRFVQQVEDVKLKLQVKNVVYVKIKNQVS